MAPAKKDTASKTATKVAAGSAVPKKSKANTGAGVKKTTSNRNGIQSKPTAYNKFIKENFKRIGEENPMMNKTEVRKRVSDLWKIDHTNPKSSNYDGPAIPPRVRTAKTKIADAADTEGEEDKE